MGRPKGGTNSTNTKLALKQKVKVDPDSIITKNTMKADAEDLKGIGYKCVCCGKRYDQQRTNFIYSRSPLFMGNDGYVPLCKSCLDKYYTNLVDFFSGNEEMAIDRCCQILDWCYSEEASAMTKKCMSKGITRISQYPAKMNLTQVKARYGTTYLDTIKNRNYTIDEVPKDGDNPYYLSTEETRQLSKAPKAKKAANKEEEEIELETDEEPITREDIIFWGTGYKPSEIRYLKSEYEQWVTMYEAQTKAQVELFKNLALMQLCIRDARQRDDQKALTDAMKTFQDLLSTSNLKPSQRDSNAMLSNQTFGTLIQEWENEKPVPECDEEFKDLDHIKKYIDTFFLGHWAKLMGVENDLSREYDEEMSKYTVNPEPAYQFEDELEEGDGGEHADDREEN